MDNKLRVIIIGGGLGGLALAQALIPSDSFQIDVYERDADLDARSQGYRIGLNEEGLAALVHCGELGAQIHFDGILDERAISRVKVANSSLGVLLSFGISGNGLVSRWLLRQRLLQGLETAVHFNKRFVRYELGDSKHSQCEHSVIAHFDDGTFAEGDILIGCDGAKSPLRSQFCPNLQLMDTGICGFGATLPVERLESEGNFSTLLRLSENSLVRILGPEAVSWLLLRYEDEDSGKPYLIWVLNCSFSFEHFDPDNTSPKECLLWAEEKAKDAHSELLSLVRATTEEDFMSPKTLKILDPTKVSQNPFELASNTQGGNVVTLLGDAAHAMTTHRGLGANTAFQDAWDLSQFLFQVSDLKLSLRDALKEYHKILASRGGQNGAASLSATQSMHVQRAPLRILRNSFLYLIGTVLSVYSRISSLWNSTR